MWETTDSRNRLFPRGGIQRSVCTRRQVSSNCPGFILLSGIVSLIQQRTTPESSSVENENKRSMHQPDQHEKYVARDMWVSRFGHRKIWSSSRSVVICWRLNVINFSRLSLCHRITALEPRGAAQQGRRAAAPFEVHLLHVGRAGGRHRRPSAAVW